MIRYLLTFICAFCTYLVLTAGSGEIGLWSAFEIGAGVIIALVVAAASTKWFCPSTDYRMANPLRWILLGIYICIPFFLEIIRANIDVAIRIITGNINPGIVKVNPGLKTGFGQLIFASSVTLTPGTLTLEANEKTGAFYIHMLSVPQDMVKKKTVDAADLFSFFKIHEWVRRIAE
jgi:multicomponent Na+:H+ antiporter subunit E